MAMKIMEVSQDEDELAPPPTPTVPVLCLHGEDLGIDAELIDNSFSAISVKHLASNDARLKSRNAFFDLSRPELSKIKMASKSRGNLEEYLHKHAVKHGEFCASLHVVNPEELAEANQLKCIHAIGSNKAMSGLEQESCSVVASRSVNNMLPNNAIQMTDEDLEPGAVCHRSPALFCIMTKNLLTTPSSVEPGDRDQGDGKKTATGGQENAERRPDVVANKLLTSN